MRNASSHNRLALIALGGFPGLLLLRLVFPERSLTAIGVSALWDHFFALALTGYLLLASWGLGANLLDRWLAGSTLSTSERVLFASTLGLGILSHALLLLGIIGWLSPLALGTLVFAALIFSRSRWAHAIRSLSDLPRKLIDRWREASLLWRLAALAIAVIVTMSVLHTLTPPWSFDALMYHLTAPREYLEMDRITLLPDLWQANGPMGIEMLYMLGLAFGSTSVARLIHLGLTGFLVLAAYSFSSRYLDRKTSGLSVLVLVSIPILPIWGNIANIDSGWALFEFLSVYAAINWYTSKEHHWLTLSALLVGFALSTKYLGLAGAATTGLVLFVATVTSQPKDFRTVLRFSLIAFLVGAPWYLLNLLRTGNPIYPFALGGPAWDQTRLGYLMTYLRSFGGENKLVSLALAPLWLYTRRELYTTFMSGIEFPSFLFPLSLLLTILPAPRPLRWLGGATLLRFLLWGVGSQQTRFLLPIYPSLAVMTGYALKHLYESAPLPRTRRSLIAGILGGLLMTAVAYQFIFWLMVRPGSVLVGADSKESFLRRNSPTFPVLTFFQEHASSGDRALLLWDGQGFYCDARCVVDAEQSKWTQHYLAGSSPVEVGKQLRQQGITHLIGNVDSLNFFLRHDPLGIHTEAAEFYLHEFRPQCTENLFGDDQTVLDRITC